MLANFDHRALAGRVPGGVGIVAERGGLGPALGDHADQVAIEYRLERAVKLIADEVPREVHLRGREDAAELVVQLARDALLLVFAHALLEAGELGELRGALAHPFLVDGLAASTSASPRVPLEE